MAHPGNAHVVNVVFMSSLSHGWMRGSEYGLAANHHIDKHVPAILDLIDRTLSGGVCHADMHLLGTGLESQTDDPQGVEASCGELGRLESPQVPMGKREPWPVFAFVL